MRAALVVGDRVNLIHDHRLHIPQDGAAFLGGQQNVQRLRCSNQDVRRPLQHRAPFVHERVAGAHRGADLRHEQTALAGQLQNFSQRHLEVLLDVVSQCLQRGDVEHLGAILQASGKSLTHQAVDAGQKRGQRLARTCGRGDQGGTPRQDVGPALLLRFGGRAETSDEPLLDQWMGPGEGTGNRKRHCRILSGFQIFAKCSPSPASPWVTSKNLHPLLDRNCFPAPEPPLPGNARIRPMV